MISRRKFLITSSVAAGFPLVARAQAKKALRTVKMSYFPSFNSLAIMVALRQGFFAKHGIEPKLVQISNGGAIEAALVSRSVDFVVNPPQLHLQTVEKGQDVRMFLNNFNAPIWSIVFTSKMPKPNLEKGYPAMISDLKGMKIGVTGRGSVQELVWRYMLKDAGIDSERDVSFISVGSVSTAIPALQQNLVQTYLASEPMQSMIQESDYAVVALDLWKGNGPEVLRKDWITNCWATRGDVIEKSPDLVKDMAAALREAHSFMQNPANFDKVITVAEEIVPTEKHLLRKAIPGVLAVTGAELPPSHIEAANRFLAANGLLKEPIPLDRAMIQI